MSQPIPADTPTAESSAQSPVAVGELLANKYRVEEVIGVGGMGIVVAAWHTELEQRVAIKFLLPSFANHPEASERFRREARAAARIRSEHVVRVLDVSAREDGVPYMVMEYLEGETLEALQLKLGRFTLLEVASVVRRICDALADAHANQIVHRDLKPPNLYLMCRSGRPPLLKLLDFGVSKSLANHTAPHLKLTQSTMLVGSPLYMSPEQFEASKEIDTRSDIWGLGVLMFELLTLQMPFNGHSVPQIIRSVIEGKRRPLSELNVQVPDEFEAVLDRCLSVDLEGRFADVHELSDALRPFAASDDSWAERFTPHLEAVPASATVYTSSQEPESDVNAAGEPASGEYAKVAGDTRSEPARATGQTPALDTGEVSGPAEPAQELDAAPLPPIPKRGRGYLSLLAGAVVVAGGLLLLSRGKGSSASEPPQEATRDVAATLVSASAPAPDSEQAAPPPPEPAEAEDEDASEEATAEDEPARPAQTVAKALRRVQRPRGPTRVPGATQVTNLQPSVVPPVEAEPTKSEGDDAAEPVVEPTQSTSRRTLAASFSEAEPLEDPASADGNAVGSSSPEPPLPTPVRPKTQADEFTDFGGRR